MRSLYGVIFSLPLSNSCDLEVSKERVCLFSDELLNHFIRHRSLYPIHGHILNHITGSLRLPGMEMKMDKYECIPCGYVYDPERGDDESGVPPGTAFEDLPDDWV